MLEGVFVCRDDALFSGAGLHAIKEKHKAQRASVRRAGISISDAAEEMKESVSVKDSALGKRVVIDEIQFQMALDKLARAGESLSNLPK